MNQKPIILTWGIGPSYRKRVKHNIELVLNSGYDNTMEYIILTDVPEDFYELRDRTKKIIDIVDIHKEREMYPWSIECEYIPTNQETYGDDYRNGIYSIDNKLFTHALDRFSIPRAFELGYSKFLMQDPDVTLYYDKIVNGSIKEEFFWDKFETPINSMKAICKETIEIKHDTVFTNARCVGGSEFALQLLSFSIHSLNQKLNLNFPPLHNSLDVTEGNLKYFNLESTYLGKRWFDVLNESAKICYELENNFRKLNASNGHMLTGVLPYAISNLYMSIRVIDFPEHEIFNTNIYADDRYFLPFTTVFTLEDGRTLQYATTQEEFYEINKEVIEILKEKNQWILTQ
jgi:hypothetical protein